MGNGRSKRLAKKGRRREELRRAKRAADSSGAELKYAVRFVLSSQRQDTDPARLAEVPSTLMSDALVELMQPYIEWPPAPAELDALEAWLRLGADVWNITVEAKDGAACARGLARLAADLDEDDAVGLVQEIARRKFAGFAKDQRRVATVRVTARGGRAFVEAASLAFVPGASK